MENYLPMNWFGDQADVDEKYFEILSVTDKFKEGYSALSCCTTQNGAIADVRCNTAPV
jgi:hypothetical protein